MKREEAAITAILVIIIVIMTAIIIWPWPRRPSPYYNPGESLPHLSAPAEIPGDEVAPIVVGNLSLSVTGLFHTMSPHNSPTTFSFDLSVGVNNTGATVIDDFQVVKVTIFYENATPVYTFGVVPSENSTILGDAIEILQYENDRDMVSIPHSFMTASRVFAGVLVTFCDNIEAILTTPLSWLGHAIE